MTASSLRRRPLSPHLQIYRPQLTSALSILHRMTGIFLALGAIFFTFWIYSLAASPDLFMGMQKFLGSWIGLALLFSWSFCLSYHFCNGIRHLFWDIGWGLSLNATYASGWMTVFVSLCLTLLIWGLPLIW